MLKFLPVQIVTLAVENGGTAANAHGVRVQFTEGLAAEIPEPGTASLLILSSILLIAGRKWR